ncbi:MAG: hypothetical protein IPK19_17085 [Chloroflexi bacterium]|nr:hypothetical protein [Chloroflexota bacterium]
MLSMVNRPLFVVCFLLLAIPLFATPTPAGAQTSPIHDNAITSVDEIIDVDCPEVGLAEPVQLTGQLHTVLHENTNPQGRTHWRLHMQFRQVTGIGLRTGDHYEVRHLTNEFYHLMPEAYPYNAMFQERKAIRNVERGFTLSATAQIHLTFNANGEMTVALQNFRVECR